MAPVITFKKTLTKTTLATLLATSCCVATMPTYAESQVSPIAIEQVLQDENYMLGLNAYLWGSTLVRMEQISRMYTDVSEPQPDTSYRAPLNEFGHARRLSTPSDLDMPSANRDTLYSSAVLDLSQEPIVLTVPDVSDRYFVINMFDMWHNLFEYVGTRETGQIGKSMLIVPPGWQAQREIPRELTVIEAPTSKVWLWGRTQVFGEQDYAKAHAVQDQYQLSSLSEYLGEKPVNKIKPLSPRPGQVGDPLRFFEELGEYLKENPVEERQQAMLGQFEKIGLSAEGFDRSKISPKTLTTLISAIDAGKQMVLAQQANPAALEMKDGWVYAFNLDGFGDDNAMRALIAHPYLGGQGAKEAIYPMAAMDKNGAPLSGNNDYSLTFDKEPPVGAFWSVTVYDMETKMLVENSIQRYSISDQTPLKKRADGSFTLKLTHNKPNESSNWLPTPEGNFYILTRLYVPSKSILNMEWTVPGIEKL